MRAATPARTRSSWWRAALLSLAVLASPLGPARASDTKTEALQAEIKAARYEAARADSDSPEQVRALEKLLQLEIRLHGSESPEIIPTIRHLAATVPLDDPQRSQKQIPFLQRILKIQMAAGPAQEAAADATRADLILYHDVSGQFAQSIPYLRGRVDYLSRTQDKRLPDVALDLSKHLLEAGDGAGARAALAVLPRACLDAWAPACAQASDQLFDLSLEADDVETLDRLGAGLIRRLRGGACEPRLLRNLSIYFGYKGDDDAGHDLYAGLLSNPACGPDERDEIVHWLELGYSDYAAVEPLRRKALEEADGGEARADAARDLGFNLWSQGRPEEAAPHLQAALDHYLQSRAAAPTTVAYAALWLARTYEATDRIGRALEVIGAASAHPSVARAATADPMSDVLSASRARLLAVSGRQTEALELLRKRRLALQDHAWVYDLPDAVRELSDILTLAGDPVGGREAMAWLAKRFGRDPSVPRPERQAIRLMAAEAASQDPATRPAALAEVRAILNDIEALKQGLAGAADATGASAREALSGDLIRSDHGRTAALGLLLTVGYAERERTRGIEAETFLAAQDLEVSAAARALAQTAARMAAGSGKLGEAARLQQSLSRDLQTISAELTDALTGNDADEVARLEDEMGRVAARLAAADAQLRKSFPQYAELASPKPLTLAEVQARLRPGEGLLLTVDLWNDTHVFAVSKTKIAWSRLAGGSDAVAERVARLRCQVDETTCGKALAGRRRGDLAQMATAADDSVPEFDLNAAYSLYNDLIAPVEPALEGVKQLFVTASGALSALPFGLLVTQAPPADAQTGSAARLASTAWLADRYALTTLPSVSSLRAFNVVRDVRERGEILRGFGDPVLTGEGFILAPADVHRGDTGRQTLANPEMLRKGLAPLPHTRSELLAIARSVGAQATSLRLGDDATEAAIKSDATLASARIVVLATHGLIPTSINRLDEPGLVFTPPSTPSSLDDGYLSASEAATLKLSADWLILSACNTAAPDGKPEAESLSGLARAFLYAGAKALLASHWSVLDDATEALMIETLAAQRADPTLNGAQALQRAMASIRTGRRPDATPIEGWQPYWAHPAAWAPFVLIGAGE
ncbi:CHAT domain-containing protein [Phenylobacterium sp.]|uniref:CHAT domain-containing protein n=1 Tax=Phenylobacterium sp. TaxID=1871053 RepID=UPI003BACFCBB